MKRSTLRFSFVLFIALNSTHVYAQWQNNLPKISSGENKYTLKEISKAFDDYWAPYNVENGYYRESGALKKAGGWNPFKREEWYWEQRVNPQSGEFPTTTSAIEFDKSQFRLNKTVGKTSTANWTNIGTSSSTGGYAGIGRINCVAFHPNEANTYWVGSPSGGIWKTTDNGSNWTVLNSSMPTIGISDIAVPNDYITSNTLYIVTGDRDGGSLWSLGTGKAADNNAIGIYKTTNGGTNWTATGLTYTTSGNKKIGRVLVASNTTTLFASVSADGIYKSIDSGISWSRVYNTSYNYAIDMEFKPGDDNTIYASTSNPYSNVAPLIYRSTDGGTSWSTVFTGSVGAGRIELGVSANDASYVYALYSYYNGSSYSLKGIYKSTDSGTNFSLVWDGTAANQNLLGYNYDASDATAGQGSYDLAIAVSPSDKNSVFIGGINTWYSTDGGSTWTIKTIWSNNTNPNGVQVVHADKHSLAFQSAIVLFEGNDGGIYRSVQTNSDWSDAGSNFVDKTNGLVISQLYRIGVSKSDITKVLTGLQDNGSKLYNNGTWTDATGGDGMECIIDHSNPTYMYASYVRGTIYRTSNGFNSKTTISNNISPVPTGAWVTPYIMDPVNSSSLYAGYDKVWKTTDRGTSWTSISGVLSSANKLRSLAIAPSNTDVIYAADLTHIWKTTDATATTPTWIEITGTLPVSLVSLTYIAVKSDDPSTLWVTFGGFTDTSKVYQSTDGGSTWNNISGTLPNIPVLCIVQSTRSVSTEQIFIGTDVGVYAKEGSNDWILYSDGMPNVVVTELEFYYGATQTDDRLRAATYGRGLWETAVPSVLPVELTRFTAITKEKSIQLDWITATENNNYGFDIERKNKNNDWEKIGFQHGYGYSNTPKFYSYLDRPEGGKTFTYRLKQINSDGKYIYSHLVEATIGNPSQFVVHHNYPNPFNPITTIRYELPLAGTVTITLYDFIGREIRTLSNKYESAGFHEFIFDGSHYASGVYYYSIRTGELLQTRKMILLK